jgi:hypothetical protein
VPTYIGFRETTGAEALLWIAIPAVGGALLGGLIGYLVKSERWEAIGADELGVFELRDGVTTAGLQIRF